jgi:hypothetical protein
MQPSFNDQVPTLAPPPRSPGQNQAYVDNTPRFNPFDGQMIPEAVTAAAVTGEQRLLYSSIFAMLNKCKYVFLPLLLQAHP